MAEIRLPFVVLSQKWGQNRELLAVLGLPEVLRIGNRMADRQQIRDYWESQLQKIEPQSILLRAFPTDLQVRETHVSIPAPATIYTEWTSEFRMPIASLTWPISSIPANRRVEQRDSEQPKKERWVAYAPTFHVLAIADKESDLPEAIQREVQAVLARSQATKRLAQLFQFSHTSGLEFFSEPLTLKIPTPRQRHEQKATVNADDATLAKVAKRVKVNKNSAAYLLDDKVQQLAELLGNRQPASVLLIGPSGVGKTAAFEELVRTAGTRQMEGFEFWRTDGSNLIAGMSGFGQWQERCQALVDELAKKKSVLHVGNLIELIEVGRGGSSTTGIADFLLPLIGQGKLLAVAECTPDQVAIAEKQIPRALDVFTRIEVTSPESDACVSVLAQVAANYRPTTRVSKDAVAMTEQLHRRFAKYSPAPGKSITFLKNLIDNPSVATDLIDSESVIRSFSRQSGLPEFLLSTRLPLDIAATQSWFSARLIGQPEPIELMVDAVAAIKTNLNRPGRPIGSFLFIGPTGVGKTEMAKAMAEFIFGDPKRLVRIDMSEYQQPLAVARLIGATGSGNGVLTNKVRENPFSVLLLDEIEKADPGVFDLLLQVLGEGRLTDGRGQTADFTNTIVILTSNLGVESYRASSLGFQSTHGNVSWREHFLQKIQQFFRPEFVNRLDRIVPFAPLELSSIKQIAAKELELVRRRPGLVDRPVSWSIKPGVLEFLAHAGHDPRYGARPLKRVILKQLIRPLSKRLNEFPFSVPVQVQIDGHHSGLHIQVAKQGKHLSSIGLEVVAQDLRLQLLAAQRRRSQSLAIAPIVVRLRNENFRVKEQLAELDKIRKKEQKLPRDSMVGQESASVRRRQVADARRFEFERRAQELDHVLSQIDKLMHEVCQYEQTVLLQYYDRITLDQEMLEEQTQNFAEAINQQVFQLFLTEHKAVDKVHLLLFSRSRAAMRTLATAYARLAQHLGLDAIWYSLHKISNDPRDAVMRLAPGRTDDNEMSGPNVDVFRRHDLNDVFENLATTGLGCAVSLRGAKAWYYFGPERGVHRFRSKKHENVLVETSAARLIEHQVPRGIETLPEFDTYPIRRRYHFDDGTLVDEVYAFKQSQITDWATSISTAVETSFLSHLNQTVELWT